MGRFRIEIKNLGPAHSPGDIVVWLPKQKMVISGDMAFHERLPPIFDDTDTAVWLESWENFEALGATYVIPGHGHMFLNFFTEDVADLVAEFVAEASE